MPVIPREEDVVAFGKQVTLLEPRPNMLPQREEIEALRKACKAWKAEATDEKRIVVFQDDEILTGDEVNALENFLENKGY